MIENNDIVFTENDQLLAIFYEELAEERYSKTKEREKKRFQWTRASYAKWWEEQSLSLSHVAVIHTALYNVCVNMWNLNQI